MAYCILDLSGEKMEITDWNVLNLLNLQTFVQKKCTVKCKASKKKNEEKVCGKNAKYQKGENFYCEQHAKCDKQYMMPKKDYTEKVLKKKKIEDEYETALEDKINARTVKDHLNKKKRSKMPYQKQPFFRSKLF